MFIHFAYQINKAKTINKNDALKLFKSNKVAGLFLTLVSMSKFLVMV